ncbi:hypothetical protein TNCV_4217401 [Trichonephila clavipes]|nr:hypothetical protein TNCV_4217401 [Trichonephila clavipes]
MKLQNIERIFPLSSCSLTASPSHVIACLGVSWRNLMDEQERTFKLLVQRGVLDLVLGFVTPRGREAYAKSMLFPQMNVANQILHLQQLSQIYAPEVQKITNTKRQVQKEFTSSTKVIPRKSDRFEISIRPSEEPWISCPLERSQDS